MAMYIMYGVADCNGEDELITNMLREKGCDIADYSTRELKSGVLQFVEKHANEEDVVLILSHYLESHNPFTVDDFAIYQQYIPNVKIILLTDIDRKGTQILQDMFNQGLYLATFVDDIGRDASLIYSLITKGRTAVEARQYYGFQSTTTTAVMRLTTQKALAHVTAPLGSGEKYKDRVDFVKKHLQTEVEFMALIDSLPDAIKNVLCEEPEYADYLTGYVAKMQMKNAGMEKQQEEKALLDRLEWGKKTLQMMSLGVAGASSRVGCTHQAVMIAYYLSSHGYHVAVVEVSGHVSPVFKKIANTLKVDIKASGYFSHDGVDFYPEFELKNLPVLNAQRYNFLVLDFGVFSVENKDELGRCSRQLIVTGSKKWETDALDAVYKAYNPGQLELCDFLFMSAPTSAKKAIMKGMAPLRRIYFADYEPNMFSRRGYHALHVLLRDYVEEKGDEGRSDGGWLQSVIDRIREFFE